MNPTDTAQFRISPGATRLQVGALCWRGAPGQVQVLLVTSRDTGRWIIPKGWPMTGKSPEAAAAQEAWEEAGVVGRARPGCLGLYPYDKILRPDVAIPCIVEVYAIEVARLRARYPESHQRRRKWFTPDIAARKVEEPDLQRLLRAFAPEASVSR